MAESSEQALADTMTADLQCIKNQYNVLQAEVFEAMKQPEAAAAEGELLGTTSEIPSCDSAGSTKRLDSPLWSVKPNEAITNMPQKCTLDQILPTAPEHVEKVIPKWIRMPQLGRLHAEMEGSLAKPKTGIQRGRLRAPCHGDTAGAHLDMLL